MQTANAFTLRCIPYCRNYPARKQLEDKTKASHDKIDNYAAEIITMQALQPCVFTVHLLTGGSAA